MRVKVVLAPVGAGSTAHETLDIACGSGQQILRWLATAACAQLAHKRGEVMGCHVPQAVLKEGTVLDVDLVLSEVVSDGGTLHVEFGPGPLAFTTRWEQRPKSPPLTWENADDSEAVEPPPSAWLRDWDLAAEGLAALALTQEQQPHAQQQPGEQPEHPQETQQPQPAAAAATQTGSLAAATPAVAARQHSDPAALAHADLEHVKDVLLQHSGALQMLFLLFTSEAGAPVDVVSRLSLVQFKSMLAAAKVTSGSLPHEQLDELFLAVQAAPGGLARRGQTQVNTSGLDFSAFLMALVHVAHVRFAAESFATGPGSSTPLSTKLLSLLQDCVCSHLFPELQRRLEKLHGAVTPASQALVKRGRRLTEQVLERCQIRRVRARGPLRVPCAYVLKHLERWGLLGREFSLHDLAPVLIHALQPTTDPYRFVLQAQPLSLDSDTFEKLLVGIAVLQARIRKKGPDAVNEVLGELLDGVFRQSGVLLGSTAGA